MKKIFVLSAIAVLSVACGGSDAAKPADPTSATPSADGAKPADATKAADGAKPADATKAADPAKK